MTATHRTAPCAILALLFSVCTVRAEPEPFLVDGLPRYEALTIREGPDAGAVALGEIPVGRRVLGFGCTADTPSGHTWCRVKFRGTVGWARRRYLTPD